jgi:hypothetical protein
MNSVFLEESAVLTSLANMYPGGDIFFETILDLYIADARHYPLLKFRMEKLAQDYAQPRVAGFKPETAWLRQFCAQHFREHWRKYLNVPNFLESVHEQVRIFMNSQGYVTNGMSDVATALYYAAMMTNPSTEVGPIELDIVSSLFGVEIKQYDTAQDTGLHMLTATYGQTIDEAFAWEAVKVEVPVWKIVNPFDPKPSNIKYVDSYPARPMELGALDDFDDLDGAARNNEVMLMICELVPENVRFMSYNRLKVWFFNKYYARMQTVVMWKVFGALFYAAYMHLWRKYYTQVVEEEPPYIVSPLALDAPFPATRRRHSVVDEVFSKNLAPSRARLCGGAGLGART